MDQLLPILAIIAFLLVLRRLVGVITVFDYERALMYRRGSFHTVLGPGQYWILPFFTTIERLDIRPRVVSITGQEVLSADGVTLKVSIAASYQIVEPKQAVLGVQDYQGALYLELQLVLRELIGAADIDTLLAERQALSAKLLDRCAPKAKAFGLELLTVSLKDIMFPGRLKEMFAQVVNAKKEGAAALEKARGETAALRCLANAARMLDDNPNLMQLRMIQALGESTGNTLVLGLPANATPIRLSKDSTSPGPEAGPET